MRYSYNIVLQYLSILILYSRSPTVQNTLNRTKYDIIRYAVRQYCPKGITFSEKHFIFPSLSHSLTFSLSLALSLSRSYPPGLSSIIDINEVYASEIRK